MRLVLLLAVLVSSGCASWLRRATAEPVYDGQSAAIQIIWVEMYERKEPPPTVYWAEGKWLDCTTGDGKHGFKPVWGGGCVAGTTHVPYAVTVARPPGARFSDTALAHELLHAAQMYDGIQDPRHVLPVWSSGNLVDVTNRTLRERGY